MFSRAAPTLASEETSVVHVDTTLTDLARSRDTGDRERLLMAVVDLCEGAREANSDEIDAVQSPLGDLFVSLVVEAEREVRHRLADRICTADWAPIALINVLALDEIEIARPIISKCPLFQDQDLVRVLQEATVDHQIEVARRSGIGAPVVDAILETGDAVVMTALACNETAHIGAAHMDRLVDESRRAPALRAPLARHPRLSKDQAERLYVWVGDSLKAAIAAKFKIDAAALDRAVAETLRDIHAAHGASGSATEDRETLERRLVEKLFDAGQLRSGYLLRALRERKFTLFHAALAKLGGLSLEEARDACDADGPERLALACLAAGIDRSVFPTVLDLVRQMNHQRPGGGVHGERRAAEVFLTYTPRTAGAALRELGAHA
jgi:uncharacterized protein (DUF2336 family)